MHITSWCLLTVQGNVPFFFFFILSNEIVNVFNGSINVKIFFLIVLNS